MLPEGISVENVEIWFQDEARFGQQGSLSRIWALKGTRPRVVRQQQFTYTYLFGAVCPERGVTVELLLPYANTDTMKVHLEYIEAEVPEGKHAVIVLDQAGWHTTLKLGNFKKISLLPLPAASPELNPCEQIWKQLRREHLSNRCFKNEEELIHACSEAWNKFSSSPKSVTSLCSREWAVA